MSIKDPNSADLYCLDFRKDGGLIAVGGSDHEIKIYDDLTKSVITSLKADGAINMGHANRVFSVRFTDDPNILVSGGWDNTVFFWDVRDGKSTGFVHGPHISGDSIDIKENVMLTGSYSNKDVLQLWSISERKLMHNIEWEPGLVAESEHGYIYSASFDKLVGKTQYIAAGGSGRNEVKFFKAAKDHDLIARLSFNKTVTCIDYANSRNVFAACCSDGQTHIYNYETVTKSE